MESNPHWYSKSPNLRGNLDNKFDETYKNILYCRWSFLRFCVKRRCESHGFVINRVVFVNARLNLLVNLTYCSLGGSSSMAIYRPSCYMKDFFLWYDCPRICKVHWPPQGIARQSNIHAISVGSPKCVSVPSKSSRFVCRVTHSYPIWNSELCWKKSVTHPLLSIPFPNAGLHHSRLCRATEPAEMAETSSNEGVQAFNIKSGNLPLASHI